MGNIWMDGEMVWKGFVRNVARVPVFESHYARLLLFTLRDSPS